MVLTVRTSSRDDFSPQGLLENVLTPLVTHCQIWPLCTSGSAVVRAWAPGGGTVSGSDTEAGTTAGAAATVATAGSVATVAALTAAGNNDGEFGAAACALAAPSGDKLGGDKLGAAVLPAEATVMTTATAATDSPPKTQGSKPVWLFMA
jgi:hypothetical protein